MRIIYVVSELLHAPNAVANHVLSSCRAFTELGHDVTLVHPAVHRERYEDSPFRRIPIWMPKLRGHWWAFQQRVIAYLRWRSLKRTADVMYFRFPATRALTRALPSLAALKVAEINGKEPLSLPGAAAFANKFDLALVATPAMASLYNKLTSFPDERIHVHFNTAVDCQVFRPMDGAACRRQMALPTDKAVLLYLSGFHCHHDFETLADGVRLLARDRSDILTVLAGDGPRRHEVEASMDDLVRAGQARFVGPISRDQLPALICASDVCMDVVAMHKLNEGNCNSQKLMQYLACARPVVETYDPGQPVDNWIRESVWLTPAGSPEDLANATANILLDPKTPDARAVNAREYLANNRTWTIAAQKTARILEYALTDQ